MRLSLKRNFCGCIGCLVCCLGTFTLCSGESSWLTLDWVGVYKFWCEEITEAYVGV